MNTSFNPVPGIFLLLTLTSCIREDKHQHSLSLWYRQPAEKWTEALPVGNGRLGAMVFGGTGIEHIQLNEESLWAGSVINNNNPGALNHLDEIRQLLLNGKVPRALELSTEYLLGTPPGIRSYQTLGDLFIGFGGRKEIRNYRRELNLRDGISRTEYESEGVKFVSEVFASAPDNIIVIHIRAENGKINATLELTRGRDAISTVSDNAITLQGQIVDNDNPVSGPGGGHMKFAALLKAFAPKGEIMAGDGKLSVKDAGSLLIILTAATDYNRDSLNFDRRIDPVARCGQILEKAQDRTYDQLRSSHVKDHRELFSRVDFDICGQTSDTIPTDLRLKQIADGVTDLHLTELYFQYGRYLLMGSSRAPGILPANLQGIWNEHLDAPWNSDFHTNINLQMNYWPADVCNLQETLEPLTRFFEKLTKPGELTARQMYGCDGWTMHHVTDPFGRTGLMDGIQWGTFPMAGAWMSLHFWDHYLFSNDTSYLRNEAWPIMKGSARFVLSFLIKDGNGQLVTAPSYSPENTYYLPGTKIPMQLTYGSSIDIQIARELFGSCIMAAAILGEKNSFTDSLAVSMSKLPPVKIGKNGTIMEWIDDYEEAEPGHRHMSHLFGLHPGTQITPESPELFKAAARTIEHRLAHGGGHTGWSRAWIVNFYARLNDPENSYRHLQALLGRSTLPNLFDNHPPFQIDGNFGGTAGIAEMLLQSHAGFIQVLPALPAAWKNGHVRGLRARGNFEVEITWKEGRLQKLVISALSSKSCKVKYLLKELEFEAEKGRTYSFGPQLEKLP